MRRFFAWSMIAFAILVFSQNDLNAQSRWSSTATDGGGLSLGDPTTITWGFVADGTAISAAFSGESNDPSSLISFLDTNIGSGAGGSDLTNRPWFTLFDSIFDRWDELSGLRFNYEPNDDGAAIDGTTNPTGSLGVRADVRIGGHSIDGQSGSNTLAYNYFPNHGDMVIDTDNVSFYSNANNNYLGLRNVLAHEFGHGMGLPHFESDNSRGLMEPFVNLTFDGPQIDDIHQAQRRYGDQFEEDGGNDTIATASDLGLFDGTTIQIGMDADQDTVVEIDPNQTDFITIDDDSDVDVWSITLDEQFEMTFVLDMLGPTFDRGPQGGIQDEYNMALLSDLDLQIRSSDGTLLSQSAMSGFNVTEEITLTLDAGTYFAQVTGRDNDAQFYSLTVSGFSAVPEPASWTILAGLGVLCTLTRRRIG